MLMRLDSKASGRRGWIQAASSISTIKLNIIPYQTAPRSESKARGELARGLRRSGFFKHRIPEYFRRVGKGVLLTTVILKHGHKMSGLDFPSPAFNFSDGLSWILGSR